MIELFPPVTLNVTWKVFGEIQQAALDFTGCGDSGAFERRLRDLGLPVDEMKYRQIRLVAVLSDLLN